MKVWFSFYLILLAVQLYKADTNVRDISEVIDNNCQEQSSSKPQLRVYFKNKLLQPQNDTYEVPQGNDNFVVQCRSKSPVKIKFFGLLPNPPESFLATVLTAQINNRSEIICHEVNVTLSPKVEITGRYECVPYSNSVEKGTSAFIHTNASFNFLHSGPQVQAIVDGTQIIIPCVGTRPSMSKSMKLFKGEIDITTKCTYDPAQGFLFNVSTFENPNGLYRCKLMNGGSLKMNLKMSGVDQNVWFEEKADFLACNKSWLVVHIPCSSPMECEFLRPCGNQFLYKSIHCQGINILKGNDSQRHLTEQHWEINRKSLKFDNGLIFCWNDDLSSKKEFNYFTDLNGRYVHNLSEIDNERDFMISNLVDHTGWVTEWHDVDEIYTEQSELIYCNVSKLFFGSKIQWKFELNDGSLINAESQDVELTSKGMPYYSTKSLIKFSHSNISKVVCQANKIDSGELTSISNSIENVKVSVPAKILNNLNETREFEVTDRKAELSCLAIGSPLPTITWHQDGHEKTDGAHVNFKYSVYPLESVINISPIIAHLNKTSTSIYCNATNSFNGTFSTDIKYFDVKIIVTEGIPPQVMNSDKNDSLFFEAMDKNASLECLALGKPLPSISWYQNGQEIAETQAFRSANFSRPRGYIRSVINISTIIPPLNQMSTHIYCNVTDSLNRFQSVLKHFNVTSIVKEKEPPVIFHNSNATLVFEAMDMNTNLTCSAMGEPLPAITWYQDGQEITERLPVTLEYPKSKGYVRSVINISTIIPDLVQMSSSIYCNATNSFNGSSSVFKYFNTKERFDWMFWIVIVGSLCVLLAATAIVSIKSYYKQKPRKHLSEIKNPNKTLTFIKKIGQGEFGIVHLYNLKANGTMTEVAVKQITDSRFLKSFIDELHILQNIGKHENVVKYIGCVTMTKDVGNFKIVVEYCEEGDLLKYIRDRRMNVNVIPSCGTVIGQVNGYSKSISQIQCNIPANQLIEWSYEIANGMEFLSSYLIHRDLAARNILISRKEGRLIAKVSDFGHARENKSDYYVSKGKYIAWRWMSIEALETSTFTVESDVWSFGITLYEIFSAGEKPYGNEKPVIDQMEKLLPFLQKGKRMPKPTVVNTPYSNEIYVIMSSCWRKEKSLRPSFTKLKNDLNNLRSPSYEASGSVSNISASRILETTSL